MDHYAVFIWIGDFSADNPILTKYFESLFPSNSQCQHIVHNANQVAFLLKPLSKCFAVFNSIKDCENVEWKDMSDGCSIKEAISKAVISDGATNEFILKNFVQKLSVSLHTLADQLPAFGTYKLDVLLDPNILKNLSFSEEPLFTSALYRLLLWHSGNFTILLTEELDKPLTEWCEYINAHIVQSNNVIDLGPPLWRGSIHIEASSTPENVSCPGFSLNLDLCENIYPESSSYEDTTQDSNYVIVSPKLHFVDQCRFSSIPSYLISPVAFRLNFNEPNFSKERSSALIEYLSNEKEEAVILRLNYSSVKEKPKPDKKYCFNRWTKAVSSRCIKDADLSAPAFKECITFIVTKSRLSDNIIAFPLRDPNTLSLDFYYNFLNLKSSILSSHVPVEEEMNQIHTLKKQLHFIEPSYLNKIMPKLLRMKMDFYENGDCNTSEIDSAVSTLWEKIRPVSRSLVDVEVLDMLCEGIDPSDWPERICLLNKQMQIDKDKKCFALDAMQSRLGHKKSQQSVSFSIEDIWQFFLPSGENKHSSSENIYSLGNLRRHMIHDTDTIRNMKWPEVLNYMYHDLYYNFGDQAEKREAEGNQMINCYVRFETVSIYSRQENAQDFSVIIPEKSSESKSQKQFRSPSYRKVQRSKVQGVKRKSNDSIEDLMKDLVTKQILCTSSTSFSENDYNKEKACRKASNRNSAKENLRKKNEFPVRCSPRKKKPVSYNYTSHNNRTSNTSITKTSKSSELSDLIRRKVRTAVGVALENNGIKLSDTFFQPCGKRLFTICKAFVQDISQKEGKMSDFLQKIADAHVRQVIEFERQKLSVK